MSKTEEILKIMEHYASDIEEVIDEEKEKGRKVIGGLPYYVPEELAYASGALPVGCWGGRSMISKAAAFLPPYACSMIQVITELAANGVYDRLDALMIPLNCDTLKATSQNLIDACPNVRLIYIKQPQNRKVKGARNYSIRELRRVRNELEEVTGTTIHDQDIYEAIEVYNKNKSEMMRFVNILAEKPGMISSRERHNVIKARYFMDKKKHTELMETLNSELEKRPAPEFDGIKAYLAGIIAEPVEILDIMDELGYTIVGDELAHETRQFDNPVPDALDQIERLAIWFENFEGNSVIFDSHKSRADIIAKKSQELGASCVLFFGIKFCDPEGFDWPWIEKAVREEGLSIMNLSHEQNMTSVEQIHTQLQTFAEQIKSK